MIKNKKSEMMHWIVVVIMMLVVLLVVIWIPGKIGQTSEQGAVDAACDIALDISENLRVLGGSLADKQGNEIVLPCSTDYISTDSEGEDLAREFADHIYQCYTRYSKKKSLFDTSRGNYCIICKNFEMADSGAIENLVDYLKTKRNPSGEKGTYEDHFGGERVFPETAESNYNFYSFERGDQIAVVFSFGNVENADYLIWDSIKETGILFYDYNDVGSLNCYSFEGRTNSLEYRRDR